MSSHPSPTHSPALLPAAASGFAPASAYDSHRPSYLPSAVSALLSHLRLCGRRRAKILDLAAGTGKFTELLVAREEGFEIVAVEPHGGMRGELVGKRLKGVQVREGSAGELPVEDGSVDGVVVAQAFHWFANEVALREIHRVLKPGGSLGLIWNLEEYNQPVSRSPTTPSMTHLKSIFHSLEDGHPRFRHEKWQACFNSQSLFTHPLGEEIHKWTHYATPKKAWDRFATLSLIVVLPGEEKEKTRKGAMELLEKEAQEARGEQNGLVAVHGVTFLAWAHKI